MNLRKAFIAAIAGIRRHRIEPGIDKDHPGVSAWDAGVMMTDAARRTFEDVEFEGSNAKEAYARRDAAIARMDARIPVKEKAIAIVKAEDPRDATKKKRRRMTRRERLEKKAIDLRAEIEALKK